MAGEARLVMIITVFFLFSLSTFLHLYLLGDFCSLIRLAPPLIASGDNGTQGRTHSQDLTVSIVRLIRILRRVLFFALSLLAGSALAQRSDDRASVARDAHVGMNTLRAVFPT